MAINKSPLKAAGGPDFGTVNIKAQPVKSVQPTNVPTNKHSTYKFMCEYKTEHFELKYLL